MIRKIIITISMLALCISTASAQEKKESGASSWFKELQKKIDSIAPRKSLSVSTGVAGVRGAKDDSSKNKLYWKGKKGDEPVTEEELNEFKEGLAFAEAGKKTEAIHEFEEFLKQHPDSALVPDAKKSLDMVKADVATEAVASPKEAPKDEKKMETK
jgi:TolA-binding protein